MGTECRRYSCLQKFRLIIKYGFAILKMFFTTTDLIAYSDLHRTYILCAVVIDSDAQQHPPRHSKSNRNVGNIGHSWPRNLGQYRR